MGIGGLIMKTNNPQPISPACGIILMLMFVGFWIYFMKPLIIIAFVLFLIAVILAIFKTFQPAKEEK